MSKQTIQLKNDSSSINVDAFGGAITSFRLNNNDINPLSFSFSKEQMPANNKAGANFQGHFLCLGRWGEPSEGEIKAGLPFHGEPANIEWTIEKNSDTNLEMNTVAAKEGLQVYRTVTMDPHNAVYAVNETVTNINPLGRLFNMVQHPTIAAPFLDESTVIDCNAFHGFDQVFYKNALSNIIEWPNARDDRGYNIDLRNPGSSYNAVYSFTVKPGSDYGWITAFSPTDNFLLGYIWKRNHYPWIHLWQHYNENKLQYRGLEFGTAGLHQPYHVLLDVATTLFGEKTYAYIDAGESVTKNYFSFCHSTGKGFTGVENVHVTNKEIIVTARNESGNINIKLTEQLFGINKNK